LPLSELRRRSEMEPAMIDRLDIGGCGCFVDPIEGGDHVQKATTATVEA